VGCGLVNQKWAVVWSIRRGLWSGQSEGGCGIFSFESLGCENELYLGNVSFDLWSDLGVPVCMKSKHMGRNWVEPLYFSILSQAKKLFLCII